MITVWSPAMAQQPSVAAVHAQIRALGKGLNRKILSATEAEYLKLQRPADRSGVRRMPDLHYGTDPKQTFDLFVPEQAPGKPMPIVVFVHGGGLVGGNKVNPNTDGLIYSNVPTFFARHGMMGVNTNYRLVPQARWPSGPEDLHLLISWLRQHAKEYGGDSSRIFLMGNSAGATHVASYLFREASHFADGPGVAGALLSSGVYAAGDSKTAKAYYGEYAGERRARAPLGAVETYRGKRVPIFMWSAEFDPAGIESSVAHMYAELCDKYKDCPRFTQFQGYNHVSQVMSLNSADTEVGDAALDFIDGVLGR